jgi:microcystin degradation protein MlrC
MARVAKLLSTDSPLERQAVVDVNGISVVLTARRRPFHEIKDFTILGLDPTRFKIVVVKAGYLVPEISAIANPNLMALTGGAVNQDIEHLESKHRVPSWPFQPDLQWKPSLVVSARSSLNQVSREALAPTPGSEWLHGAERNRRISRMTRSA